MIILQTKGLTKIYGTGDTAVHALDGVDITVEKRRIRISCRHLGQRQVDAASHAWRSGPSDFWVGDR